MGVRVHTNSYQSIQITYLPYPIPTYPPPLPFFSPNSVFDHDNFIILNQQHKNSNNLCRKLNIVKLQSFEVNKFIFSINSFNSFVHTKKYKEIYKKNFKGRDYSLPFVTPQLPNAHQKIFVRFRSSVRFQYQRQNLLRGDCPTTWQLGQDYCNPDKQVTKYE